MQLPSYYASVADCLDTEPSQILIAAFFEESALVGILPLRYVTLQKFGAEFGILEFANTPIPTRDFLTSKGLSLGDLLDCLSDQFKASFGEQWDMIRLEEIARPLSTDDIGRFRGTSPIVSIIGHDNRIELGEGNYITESLSGNMRSNLRRRKKKLAKLGEFEFRTVSSFPDLEQAFDDFVETEAAGWKSVTGGKRAIKLHPDQRDFYFDLLKRFAAQDLAHIHLLELNGKAVASDYCLLAGDTVYSLKHGFDETYSDVTPSNLLREYTIEYYSASDAYNVIDLVSGWDWQDRWKPVARDVRSIKAFNRTPAGQLLRLYTQAKTFFT